MGAGMDIAKLSENSMALKRKLAQEGGVAEEDINNKNLGEVKVALAGAKKIADEGEDPTKYGVKELKEVATGSEDQSSPSDLSNQQKIAMALTAILPTIVGGAIGGKRGAAIGAESGLKGVEAIGKGVAEDKKYAQGVKEKREELAAKSQESALARADKAAENEKDRALRKETAQMSADAMRSNRGIQNELQQTRLDSLKKENDAKEEKRRFEQSAEGKLAKMGIEEKKRFDNNKEALESVQKMSEALLVDDQDTFKIFGDNTFTAQLDKFENALGRMESGGQIGELEGKKFRERMPTFRDSAKIQREKLQDVQQMLVDRFRTLGISPEEVGVNIVDISKLQKNKGGETKPFGIERANAAPKPVEEMSQAEMDAYEAQLAEGLKGKKPNTRGASTSF